MVVAVCEPFGRIFEMPPRQQASGSESFASGSTYDNASFSSFHRSSTKARTFAISASRTASIRIDSTPPNSTQVRRRCMYLSIGTACGAFARTANVTEAVPTHRSVFLRSRLPRFRNDVAKRKRTKTGRPHKLQEACHRLSVIDGRCAVDLSVGIVVRVSHKGGTKPLAS